MDALTWFKAAIHREGATPEPSPAVPLHLAAARLRPSQTAAPDGDDWDAAIARAKMRAAWEMQVTPRPAAPSRVRPRETTQATLDALVGRGHKKPAAARSLSAPAKRP
jgi:hypothetical protein